MAKLIDVIEGLQILARHAPEGEQSDAIVAAYRALFAGHGVAEDRIPREEGERLKALGWSYNKAKGYWVRFV